MVLFIFAFSAISAKFHFFKRSHDKKKQIFLFLYTEELGPSEPSCYVHHKQRLPRLEEAPSSGSERRAAGAETGCSHQI